ncbi:hypothetical protein QFC20_004029 [Naganishia adeliensis]|uniref:Uncharacterized protein n=1 Tax=Naganishia adeliensis TaxID=92952 RepID=A0ACC2W5M2_9TREE|nr:hypothetical protein QFC20_004029 [Naganishia adeliensis]
MAKKNKNAQASSRHEKAKRVDSAIQAERSLRRKTPSPDLRRVWSAGARTENGSTGQSMNETSYRKSSVSKNAYSLACTETRETQHGTEYTPSSLQVPTGNMTSRWSPFTTPSPSTSVHSKASKLGEWVRKLTRKKAQGRIQS